MKPTLLLATLLLLTSIPATATEPCQTFHGRAHFYGGDGQLRVWHSGTHHEFEPDETTDVKVMTWLEAGVPDAEKHNYAIPASDVMLFGDFTVCPIEPLRKGWVQRAKVLSVTHRRYVRLD
jgi:hypothetical protein